MPSSTTAETPPPEETPGRPGRRTRKRRIPAIGSLGRVFGSARRGAQQLLTPIPEEPTQPVPPVVVTNESRLLGYSPFSIGFYGALGVLIALALAGAIGQVQGVLFLVLVALFLALGISPAVEFLTRRRVPRGVAVLIISVVGIGIITLGVNALVPILTQQVQELTRRFPSILESLTSNAQIAQLDEQYHIVAKVQQFLTSGELIQNLFGGIWGAGRLVANLVFSVIITTVLTVYFVATLPSIKETIYKLAPASRRARARYLADEIFRGVSGYITGMFVIVSLAAIASFIFMNIVGLGDYALALAFIVALFSFIPVVGPLAAMAIVTLVGFAVSSTVGIATLIYFLVYQQFEAYVLYPNIMKRAAKVPGVLVVLSAILGGILLGVIGALIAIPTMAAILLLYREVVQPHLDAT